MKTANSEKKKQSISTIWKNNIYALKTLFGPTPVFCISIVIEAVRHNLINFLEQTICVFKVLEVIENDGSYLDIVKVIVIFLLLDFVAAGVSSMYEQKIKVKYLPIAERALKMKLYEKAREVDIENYDNPEYYNNYCLVVAEAKNAITRAEKLVRMAVGSIVLLCCYGTFFLTQDALSVIFVFASFILRTILANMSTRLTYRIKLKEVPLERKRDYIRRVFYLKDYAKELRLNKKVAGGYHEQFDEIQDELYEVKKSMAKKKFFLEFASKYLASDFMLDIVYVLYLILRSLFNFISFSQVVVLYNSAAGLRRGFSTITDLGPFAVETSLYIEKIRDFLDMESNIRNEKKYEIPSDGACIECRNVCFGYDKEHMILNDINLTINQGQKIALVGFNGAGKTTLIKLLLRLYDPTSGNILLNGHDIREYDIAEYRRFIGVVFQDFQIYATNIRNNVSMDVEAQVDDNKIMEALRLGGLGKKLDGLDAGIETELTKEFDNSGTEFSGGEEQKLAVARTFFRDAGMFFLDEPSSALDPIAEFELNETMKNLSKEKSVIFISHRLSTTRNADKIFVMKNGSIVESGSHRELLEMNGIYNIMWNSQACKYIS